MKELTMEPQRVTLRKIEELPDAPYPNNIPMGNSYTGVLLYPPKVGEAVYVAMDNGGIFNTIERLQLKRLLHSVAHTYNGKIRINNSSRKPRQSSTW